MSSQVGSLRADDSRFAAWRAMADRLGLSFNAWATRALDEQRDLDEALVKEREARDER